MKSLKIIAPLFFCVIALIVYLYTASPFTLWLDGPRFLACIVKLEICNPPEPTFVLLAHLFLKLIPFGKVLFKIHILTSLLAVGVLLIVYWLIVGLIEKNAPPAMKLKYKSQKAAGENLRIILAGLFGLISFSFSYQLWSQAQNVETFVLLTLLGVGVIYFLLIDVFEKNFFKRLMVVAFLMGLGAGTNPIILSITPFILGVMWINRRWLGGVRRLVVLVAIGVVTVIGVYGYLPIRALQNPFINWSRPTNLPALWGLATGEGLNVYRPEIDRVNGFTGSPIVFLKSSLHYFAMIWQVFTPFLLPFFVLGAVYLYQKSRKIFWLLISICATNFIFSGLYYSGNQESWFLVSESVLAVFGGLGFYWLTGEVVNNQAVASRLGVNIRRYSLVVFLAAFSPLLFWFGKLDRHQWFLTQDYIDNLYRPIKLPAIFLGSSDLFDSVSLYVHEGDTTQRSKIIPVTDNMFYALKWYRGNLATTTGIKIPDDSYIGYNDPDEYSRFINEFFKLNIKNYHIYINLPSVRNNFLPREDLRPSLIVDPQFKLVPQGMVYQLLPKEASGEPDLKNFNYSFKSPGFPKKIPFYLERVYNGELTGMINEYAISYQNLGDYYAKEGKKEQVLKYYQKAHDFNPKNPEIISRMGNYYGAIGDHFRAYYYFKKALEIDPKDISLMFNVGMAAQNSGNLQVAVEMYQKVLQNAKANSLIAPAALQQLNNLTGKTASPSANLKNYENRPMNIKFSYPQDFTIENIAYRHIRLDNGKKGSEQIVVEIVSRQISDTDSLDELADNPPIASGSVVFNQSGKVRNFEANFRLYSQGNKITRMIILKTKNLAYFLQIWPADSSTEPIINLLLQTIDKIF